MSQEAVGRRVCAVVAMTALLLIGLSLPSSARSADAPSSPRASLLPLAKPLWSELSPAQQQLLRELEPDWNGLPATKKRSWLTIANRIPQMDATDREKVEARIREWARLTPEQRQLARNNFRLAKSLPKTERVATWEQYQQMSPEQQSVLRANGWTSNTAARHAGAPTGLAKRASRPIPGMIPPALHDPAPPASGIPAPATSTSEAERGAQDSTAPAPTEQETKE